jgi:hypothetical protein
MSDKGVVMRRLVIGLVGAGITMGFAAGPPASAAGPGTCSVVARIDVHRDGRIAQSGPGSAWCAGNVGPSMVSTTAVPAYLSGSAKPGATSCAPILTAGELRLAPYRLVSFDSHPEGTLLTGAWTAVGTPGLAAVRGTGTADGVRTTLFGEAAFTPDSGRCVLGEVASGTLRLDLALSAGQPSRTPTARGSFRARRVAGADQGGYAREDTSTRGTRRRR